MGGFFALIAVAVMLGVPVALIAALARINALRDRVDMLERRLNASRDVPREAAQTAAPTVQERGVQEREFPVRPVIASAPPSAIGNAAPPASRPDWLELLLQRMWRWFTEGNVPVKVGVLVLFAGVAALLKYATDQGWMHFPIPLRLTGIAAAALAALVFGWRQRALRRTFALGVQGGAIGVLLMTVFAAFRLYGLIGPGPALGLCVLLVAAAGLLAMLQDARALAVLGILAGFLSPLLIATGSHNHVALFSFYAVLNAAIFGIAWYRPWRELNLLGFVFTFGIGAAWGVLDYRPEKLSSTLPFLALFFALYLLIPLFYARRSGAWHRNPVDGCLVFGTPLLSFALLAGLLEGGRTPLALTALALGALYGLLGWQLYSRERFQPLAQCHVVLAVGFVTLSIPLALSAPATAGVLALEGAALVWLGLRQARRLTQWSGAALQVLAALAYVTGYLAGQGDVPVVNAGCMGALLLALAGFAGAWCHRRAGSSGRGALLFYLWGLLWWLWMGLGEIDRFMPRRLEPDGQLGFAALTAAVAAAALLRERAMALGWTIFAALAVALQLAPVQSVLHGHPFAQYGLPAWVAYAAAGGFALRVLRGQRDATAGWSHVAWLLAWSLALMLWLQRMSVDLAQGWQLAALALPWLLVAAGLVFRPHWISWPLAQRFEEWRRPLLAAWQAIMLLIAVMLLFRSGDAAPLPWIPMLNPLELCVLAVLLLLAAWLWTDLAPVELRTARAPLLCCAVFAAATSMTLRAVHHLGGVPWNSALLHTALAQTSLSLVWSVFGVVGWIAGSRRGQRALWRAGALLMGIVLAKLLLIDRQHLGNLPGIASFIGYGLLCTAVGYLAPAPPRGAGSQPDCR